MDVSFYLQLFLATVSNEKIIIFYYSDKESSQRKFSVCGLEKWQDHKTIIKNAWHIHSGKDELKAEFNLAILYNVDGFCSEPSKNCALIYPLEIYRPSNSFHAYLFDAKELCKLPVPHGVRKSFLEMLEK